MVSTDFDELAAEFSRAACATFPGSPQAQQAPWSVLSHVANHEASLSPDPDEGSFFFAAIYHTDFDPEWPIPTDWPAVVRGLRGSMGVSQAEFAEVCRLGRATVERWESGRSVPFRGDALTLLTLVRPNLKSPIQRGQALNLAAAAVLPQLARPTAEYLGTHVAGLLRSREHDHSDLGPGLLSALVESRILVTLDPSGNELEDSYIPLAYHRQASSDVPEWAPGLIRDVESLSSNDRRTVISLVKRLAQLSP
ncbi:helix-turn-helix domain-containing protein [Aeromicrobium ginsengisoli]|uniref:Helix-turn-helix domain-containing protein n=1 Tax=Aeromicrobium ginsengisoli TaxID=363867 RepID=A0A5M4FG71_9ACTN|nr:helix-turn-helix domain-containing protein [Aeromicrobium ginsengisoli]